MKNRILLEYSLLSLLFTTAIALTLSGLIVERISEFALNQHSSFLLDYFDSIPTNYPELAESIASGGEPDDHAVDHFAKDLFLFPSITRIRIADPDGLVFWEMEREGSPDLDSPLPGLIADSAGEILVSILESDFERHPGLSILYPYRIEGRVAAYIQATDNDSAVHRLLVDIRRTAMWLVGLAGIILYLLLFVVFYRSYRSLRLSNRRLERTQEVTIRTMSRLAELRDNETGSHIDRTSRYCGILAEELRHTTKYAHYIHRRYIDDLKRSAPLHDIGKVGIPDSILNKPGSLSAEEWKQMKLHPVHGARILKAAMDELDFQSYFEIGYQVVLGHHENWDGSGYPEGVSGEQIPLSARIMAVADVYDALRTERPYKEPMSHSDAVAIISRDRGRKFDPEIVDAFMNAEDRFREISEMA